MQQYGSGIIINTFTQHYSIALNTSNDINLTIQTMHVKIARFGINDPLDSVVHPTYPTYWLMLYALPNACMQSLRPLHTNFAKQNCPSELGNLILNAIVRGTRANKDSYLKPKTSSREINRNPLFRLRVKNWGIICEPFYVTKWI